MPDRPPIRRARVVRPPALDPKVLGMIDRASAEVYPGTPVLPMMTTGAGDAVFLDEAGIPTCGVEGLCIDPDHGFAHGLDEHIGVASVRDGRRFHYKLVKLLTQ